MKLRLSRVIAIWMRHFVAFRSGWMVEATGIILEPMFILIAIGFGVGQFVDQITPNLTYQEFIAPGVVVGSAMWHALFHCSWGAYQRMKEQHLYETILITPVNLSELVGGEIMWGATRSVMTTTAVLGVASILGLISSPFSIFIIVVGFFAGLMFGAIGLICAATAPNNHSLMLVFTMIGSPLFFFGGVFFPIDSLPDYLEPVAWVMPLTPAVHIARGLSLGEFDLSHIYSVIYMVGLVALLCPVATALLKRRVFV